MKPIESYITSIPDFPEPGIIFRDITSVLTDPAGLRLAVDEMEKLLEGVEFDAFAGLESRGFLFGMPLAYNLNKAFIPIRKKGKLPRETVEATYDLEYGSATIEVHKEDVMHRNYRLCSFSFLLFRKNRSCQSLSICRKFLLFPF